MLFRRRDNGMLAIFSPSEKVMKTERTANLCYADGRQEEVPVDPYTHQVTLPGNAEAVLSDAELADCGLIRAVPLPFAVPAGFVAVGPARYVERSGGIAEEYDVEKAPTQTPATPAEKLAALGLTADDLAELVREPLARK